MVANASLTAVPRAQRGKGGARKLRAAGRVPAVVYGHGEETRSLTVDAHELERLFAQIHKENTIINLRIEGGAEIRALVREVQAHPFRGNILHVDFYQIHAGERITVEVPIVLTGTPEGVKLGGMLQHALDGLEIRCLPDQIPNEIRVDVSHLGIGDSVHVSDLTVPAGIELLVDEERTVCSVIAPTVVTAEVPAEGVEPEAAAPAEPEVIRRGKEEEAEES
ncbi:MAG TPA: 50S ribosomal protein L25/general stress protein Ctc [Longimicrobiales bacterium]|nr:50S ribosomal protein L25/general stress protein Ctc [Longimicrobiales bacterium]